MERVFFMKIGICDDDRNTCDFIKSCCEKLGYEEIELFYSGEELLNYPYLSSLNLLFLDIEMSKMDGILVKNCLEETFSKTYIIFCTSHIEVMPEAFGKNVILFLNKPLHETAIEEGVKKALFFIKEQYVVAINPELFVTVKDILYLSSEQKYTVFYLFGGRTGLSHESLSSWLPRLIPYGFSSISRSYIINMRYCIEIRKHMVLLKENICLKISRRLLSSFKKEYEMYQIKK